jgi:hypothetical protein
MPLFKLQTPIVDHSGMELNLVVNSSAGYANSGFVAVSENRKSYKAYAHT